MSVETLIENPEFEQNVSRETERTFLPILPETLDDECAESRCRTQRLIK